MRWLGERRPLLGLDVETSGLSLAQDRIRLAQLGDSERGWAVPWDRYSGIIKEAVESYRGPMVGHHLKFDASFLARGGVRVDWSRAHDTLPMCFLVNSMGPKALKGAAGLYVDRAARNGQAELKEVMARNGWDWGTIPLEHPTYWGYAAGDPVLTCRLAETLWPRVQPFRQAYDLELACERVLCEMELRGVRIDVAYCQNQLAVHEDRLEQLLAALAPLNPNAPHQVAAALQSYGLELTKRTKAGKLAVDDDVLRRIISTAEPGSPELQIATLVSEARDVQKLISAFFRNFLTFRNGDILHPHFNQLAARTGRMSVSEPALQQVPKTSLVRDAFIPREGNRILLCDYDAQEVRLAAHYSHDERLLEALREGRDLHAETAQRVYDVEVPTRAQRDVGKTGFFSKSYGAGIPKFAWTVGLPEADAARVFNTLNELYPGLNEGMMSVTRVVRQRAAQAGGKMGFVRLADGRHLAVPTDKAYKGWNFLIQGTGASVMKQALVDLDRVGLGEYLTLTVHDEVMLDVPEALVEDAARVTTATMQRDDFAVPLTTKSTVVDRWGDPYD